MTTADDMNTLAGLGDTIVDTYLGGHADANLTTFLATMVNVYSNETVSVRILAGLVAELIDKVYDLEHPV